MQWSRLLISILLLFFSFSVRAEAGVVAFALGDTNVAKGALIEVGQTITTGRNGHVHIKFIDGALISVRPNSSLTVEAYTFDPDHPENNRVKFYLEAGTVRSVTGEAGRLNKKGFRMNTPISAIGIRGTDYTVTTTDTTTRVFVQSGGVALAPLSKACQRSGFGVCQSSDLVELYAGDEHIIELTAGQSQARLLDFGYTLRSPAIGLGDAFTDSVLADEVIDASSDVKKATSDIGWGHWSNFEDILNHYFLPISPYYNEQWRVASSNSMFGLFLSNDYQEVPRTGHLSLSLDRYQAFSVKDQIIRPASMRDAHLSVDFSSGRFATQFDIVNSDVNTTLSAQGSVDRLGFLRGDGVDGLILNGALNASQSQAGVIFEQQISDSLKVLGASAWVKD